MAAQMNALEYDAVALGNHEFNYGLDFLDNWISQMDAPVLAANAVHAGTKVPRYTPYTITSHEGREGAPARQGRRARASRIPGVVIWDKANVSGKVEVLDLVETAKRWVPVMKAEGAHIIVVSAHSGESGTSSYGPDLPIENAAKLVAEQVPGVDVILFGHAHAEIPERLVTNLVTGAEVIMSEPKNWGQRLSVFDLDLEFARGKWSRRAEHRALPAQHEHRRRRPRVRRPRARPARRGRRVHELAGRDLDRGDARPPSRAGRTPRSSTTSTRCRPRPSPQPSPVPPRHPCRSSRSPRRSTGPRASRQGQVTIKDVAGLYIYDNTLMASILTGAQIKAYLEFSAEYFKVVAPDAPVDPGRMDERRDPDAARRSPPTTTTTSSRASSTRSTSRSRSGSASRRSSYDGAPVADGQQFVVAVNNYRQSGGGGFPHIATAPVVYNAQVAIREAIVAYASAEGTIDPATFHVENWRLVRNGVPVF